MSALPASGRSTVCPAPALLDVGPDAEVQVESNPEGPVSTLAGLAAQTAVRREPQVFYGYLPSGIAPERQRGQVYPFPTKRHHLSLPFLSGGDCVRVAIASLPDSSG